jgi:hypothetical protein
VATTHRPAACHIKCTLSLQQPKWLRGLSKAFFSIACTNAGTKAGGAVFMLASAAPSGNGQYDAAIVLPFHAGQMLSPLIANDKHYE